MKYLFSFIALLLIGCGGSSEMVIKEESQPTKIKYDESFDPLSLNDDDIIIEQEKIPEENIIKNNSDPIPEQSVPRKEVAGFRVQLVATKNIESASFVEQDAKERFALNGYETYLIFESPLYKIRVGDCTDKESAEELRDLAKDYGYREAFVVKSKVILSSD